MHDKRKALCRTWIEEYLRSADEDPGPEAFEPNFDDIGHQSPTSRTFDDEILRFSQSVEPIKKDLSPMALAQAGRGDSLNYREKVLGSMLQFSCQQVTPLQQLARFVLTTTRT